MLYFIYSCLYINHVYCIPDRKEHIIVDMMDQYSQYIETRWNLKIMILYGDSELSELVGKRF